jgi:DNA-binding CsgD family transcriptional regulator
MEQCNSHQGIKLLSNREREVARLIAKGYSEKEIASKLFVSVDTIHSHAYRIRKKINARSAVDVCRKFILSLENPKQILFAFGFLMIQSSTMVDFDIDLRKPSRLRLKNQSRNIRTRNQNKALWN